MREEFTRALSLIFQRLEQSPYEGPKGRAAAYQGIRNCVEISYDASMTDQLDAHGMFHFDQTSTRDRLEISVSPSYSLKDDLLTALLLVHELNHALYHATGADQRISCFRNEADAFLATGNFMANLNPEEWDSLKARAARDPSSLASQEIQTQYATLGAPGSDVSASALAWVQAQPAYQQECAGR